MNPKKSDYFYKTPDMDLEPNLLLIIIRKLLTILFIGALLAACYLFLFRRSYPAEVGIIDRIINNYYVLRSDIVSFWQEREVVPASEMPKPALTNWVKFNLTNYIKYSNFISEQAYKAKVDPDLARALIVICSHFEIDWTGEEESKGLMCLRSSKLNDPELSDAHNPEQNISSGTRFLSQLLSEQQQQKDSALARYYQAMLAKTGETSDAQQQEFIQNVNKAYALLQGR